MAQLKSYPWPGNVRELRNVIERAALLAEVPKPQPLQGREEPAPASDPTTIEVDVPFKDQKNALIAEFERAYVHALLASTEGNIAAAARKAKIDIGTIENALDQYRLDMFSYPTTEQGLEALVTAPAGDARTDQYRPGGYLRAVPVDPWGRPYRYRYPGERGAVDIFSLGADGEPGGEGVNADIVNWTEEN